MTVGSGIGGQVGIAAESTYGTYETPARFLPFTGSDLKKTKNSTDLSILGAGQLMKSGYGRVDTTKGGGGTLECPVVNKGMGLLLQALMGTTVTPAQQAATAAYLQTHTLADTVGKSLTVQAGIPNVSGTAHPYSFLGCKVLGAEFGFEVEKEVTASFDLDARDVTEGETLAAASFDTGLRPFVGTDTSIKVGAFGSEAAVTGVKKATVKFERGLGVDRHYFGASGLKAEPNVQDFASVTGTISADLVDKAVWADRFRDDAEFSIVLEAVGAVIEGAYSHTFRITIPGCRLEGDTPTLSGQEVVSGDFPFVALFDDTNLPKIEVISTDTTV